MVDLALHGGALRLEIVRVFQGPGHLEQGPFFEENLDQLRLVAGLVQEAAELLGRI